MQRALYIGRFQPFHLGHLDAIQQILAKEDHLLIGIGSAEQSFLPDNPFTAAERIQMIQAALTSEKIDPSRYTIIPIRNINNYALWVKHVESYCPPFKNIYTGSQIVRQLFETEGTHPVLAPTFNHKISATQVRQNILGGKDWQSQLHPQVAKLLTKWKAKERVKNIQ